MKTYISFKYKSKKNSQAAKKTETNCKVYAKLDYMQFYMKI